MFPSRIPHINLYPPKKNKPPSFFLFSRNLRLGILLTQPVGHEITVGHDPKVPKSMGIYIFRALG